MNRPPQAQKSFVHLFKGRYVRWDVAQRPVYVATSVVLGVCCWQTAPEAAAETAALSPAPALYQERPHLR